MKKIAFIWAENSLGYIGKDGVIPWNLPDDMQFFKEQTKGHPVVMGRRTFDSLHVKPLPERENIVLTRNPDWSYAGVTVVHSVAQLLHHLEQIPYAEDETIFVIGGAQIYEALVGEVDLLYITKVQNTIAGDTKMPQIDLTKFELIKELAGRVDERNIYPHHFYIYQRNDLARPGFK
ncbi:dfrA protein [Amylolactobacillus amylotrophicus DSM 20534]|uniref:Dihydrofolate reductase n=3 Tax=Amylolactobacillus TaxID=2767876 RepID=A0A0R1YSK4_9LACO|nr:MULTISPECIES: dihydrofolate reductase [Amylolactobacillus]APT19176.1 hypothetical protein LA20533_07915 [Amylolactobacillus amylophilus DSM 20533 = JCM 1125]KRK38551.1 dfrA protein [Amylolactobacillus amylotrophicus DSM 20534]KRM42806.1 dfrA protein [Amylolactobacillus amylophilus DSM 20533 = JCM 1125]GED79669.1 dihydrofolate reductase [Amylolactobacillus amylophilus]